MATLKPIRECRFIVHLHPGDVAAFREALVDLAGGFTEIARDGATRYIVGLGGDDADQRIEAFVAQWKPRTAKGGIALEDQSKAPDRDEVYFLLPLQRNPPAGGGPRRPLFTNEQMGRIRDELARRFHFRPEVVSVYGQWRNASGELIPDHSFLIRVPRRSPGTVAALRRFIRREVLEAEGCDQDCIYLSSRWRGEFVSKA